MAGRSLKPSSSREDHLEETLIGASQARKLSKARSYFTMDGSLQELESRGCWKLSETATERECLGKGFEKKPTRPFLNFH